MRGKKGVCRHYALAAGAILERICDEGLLGGKANVKKNHQLDNDGYLNGGHVWVQYINSIGEIGVLDPAQEFVGLRSNATN